MLNFSPSSARISFSASSSALHSSGNLICFGILWAPFMCAATSAVITLPRSVTSVQGSCFSMSAWCDRSLKWLADWHHIASLSNWNSQGFIYFQFLQTAQCKLKPDLRLVAHIAHWDLWHFSWERHIIGGVLPQTSHFWRTRNMTNDGNSHFFAMWALGQCVEPELHPLQKQGKLRRKLFLQ